MGCITSHENEDNVSLQGAGGRGMADTNEMSTSLLEPATKVFQNEVILAQIAKHLEMGQILTLRSTHRGWNRNFVPELRTKHESIALSVFEPPFSAPPDSKYRINEFVQLMKSSSAIPYGRYVIFDVTANEKTFCDFFATCGPFINSLNLSSHVVNTVNLQLIREAIFLLTPSLVEIVLSGKIAELVTPTCDVDEATERIRKHVPKLKAIEVSARCTPSGAYKDFLSDLFEYSAGIECLRTYDLGLSDQARLGSLLLSFLGKKQGGFRGRSLKTLQLRLLDLPCLDQLTWMSSRSSSGPLRLTSFMVSIDYLDSDFSLFEIPLRNFLASQSETLKNLEVKIWSMLEEEKDPGTRRQAPICIPRLEGLQLLSLGLHVRTDAEPWEYPLLVFEDERLANNFPALTSLSLKTPIQRAAGAVSTDEINAMAHVGVAELKLSDNYYDLLLNLPGLCPSVRKLKSKIPTHNYETSLPELHNYWTLWPMLTCLKLKCVPFEWLNLDEFLSGVPASVMETAKCQLDKDGPMKLRKVHRQYKTKPSLSDLLHLRELKLRVHGCFTFTDIGGYFGFGTASRKLQHIDVWLTHRDRDLDSNAASINSSTQTQLTSKCMKFIRTNAGPSSVFKFEVERV